MKKEYSTISELKREIESGSIDESRLMIFIGMDRSEFEIMNSRGPFSEGIKLSVHDNQGGDHSADEYLKLFPKAIIRRI